MTRDLELEQRWRERIEECRQSGMSIREWCAQNELRTTAYKYWVRKFNLLERQATEGNTFAEVILLPETINSTKATGSTSGISLSLGDFSIGISDGFNPITLTELVKVLKKL